MPSSMGDGGTGCSMMELEMMELEPLIDSAKLEGMKEMCETVGGTFDAPTCTLPETPGPDIAPYADISALVEANNAKAEELMQKKMEIEELNGEVAMKDATIGELTSRLSEWVCPPNALLYEGVCYTLLDLGC